MVRKGAGVEDMVGAVSRQNLEGRPAGWLLCTADAAEGLNLTHPDSFGFVRRPPVCVWGGRFRCCEAEGLH